MYQSHKFENCLVILFVVLNEKAESVQQRSMASLVPDLAGLNSHREGYQQQRAAIGLAALNQYPKNS